MNAYILQYLLCVFAATVLHEVLQIILLGKSRAIKKKKSSRADVCYSYHATSLQTPVSAATPAKSSP